MLAVAWDRWLGNQARILKILLFTVLVHMASVSQLLKSKTATCLRGGKTAFVHSMSHSVPSFKLQAHNNFHQSSSHVMLHNRLRGGSISCDSDRHFNQSPMSAAVNLPTSSASGSTTLQKPAPAGTLQHLTSPPASRPRYSSRSTVIELYGSVPFESSLSEANATSFQVDQADLVSGSGEPSAACARMPNLQDPEKGRHKAGAIPGASEALTTGGGEQPEVGDDVEHEDPPAVAEEHRCGGCGVDMGGSHWYMAANTKHCSMECCSVTATRLEEEADSESGLRQGPPAADLVASCAAPD
mmetsp:Transcript_22880/g.62067  ORF Transcript_22880/g.62067 Transcript_22880/m.62067 type:complete len:299 (-) Transcript_22880:33-929(-)